MIHIRLMHLADLPLGMRLTQQNGWNQTEADWRRILALQPDGCVVAEWNGEPAATTAAIVFGEVAWVAMVLVDASLRGRGIGTALMQHALAFLKGRGIRRIRLDATPLGQPIYEKLGFVAEYQLARFAGTLPQHVPEASCHKRIVLRPLFKGNPSSEAMPGLLRLDQRITGTDRRDFLRRFLPENAADACIAECDGDIAGYVAGRPGARAAMIGPCLASAEAGPMLLTQAAQRRAGQAVFIDIPLGNPAAAAVAEAWGLTVQRQLLRMGRGERVVEQIDALWASSGPEKG